MTFQTKLLMMALTLLAGGFALAYLRVLGAWANHHVSRHDLIAASRRRRNDYLKSLAEREQMHMGGNASILIEDAQAA